MNSKKACFFSALFAIFLGSLVALLIVRKQQQDERDVPEERDERDDRDVLDERAEDRKIVKVDLAVEKVAKFADTIDIPEGEDKGPHDRIFGYFICHKACNLNCATAGYLGNASATCVCWFYRIPCT